jgi:hypothetical protein
MRCDATDNRNPDKEVGLEPIRVIFIDMPTLVRQMLSEAVSADPRLVIEDCVADPNGAADVLAHAGGGVVLVGDSRIGERTIEDLLRRAPDTALLAVHASGDGLDLYMLKPRRVSLGEASPQRVVDVIHEIGDRRRRPA